MNQRRAGGHAHITGLNILDDFVLLTLVSQLEVLAVKIKGGSRVVRHVELHLVANRCHDIGLNLLLKVEVGFTTLGQGKRRVIGDIGLHTHIDNHRTGGLEFQSTAEYPFQSTHTELHIQEIEGISILVLCVLGILLPVVLHHRPSEIRVAVFIRRHDIRSDNVIVTQLGVNHIATGLRVKFNLRGDV